MTNRLRSSAICWLLSLVCAPTLALAQLPIFPFPPPVDPVQEAIRNKQATDEATRVATQRMETTIWQFGLVGADEAAKLLQRFVDGTGTDEVYSSTSEIVGDVRNDHLGNFTFREAHETAMTRIRSYFEGQIREGRTDFPTEMPLSDLGFTESGANRLQGPDLSNAWRRGGFLNPVRIELALTFGDMQGPHRGQLSNVQVTRTQLPNGDWSVSYSFDVQYDWSDRYTFNNDSNRGGKFAAAHYLEKYAKTAKEFRTYALMSETVTESFVLRGDGQVDDRQSSSQPGPPVSARLPAPAPGNGSGNGGGGNGGNTPGGSTTDPKGGSGKVRPPPINIKRPPGWGVGK